MVGTSADLQHGAKFLEQLRAQPVYDRPALAALLYETGLGKLFEVVGDGRLA